MALGELNSAKTTSGSSDSGDSDEFPKYREVIPYFAFIEHNGEFKAVQNPQSWPITQVKEWHTTPWKLEYVPDSIEQFWMSEDTFQMHLSWADNQINQDIVEIIREEPKRGCEIIYKVKTATANPQKWDNTVQCPVCGGSIDPVTGRYEFISNRRVCVHHSVKQVAEAGLLD